MLRVLLFPSTVVLLPGVDSTFFTIKNIKDKTMAIQVVPQEKLKNFIGQSLEPGEWIEVSQERINDFADCTEDHQFIHIDPIAAAKTPFGGTIAHGFLSLSLLPRLCDENKITPENVVMGINYGFDKVRFLAPVSSGKRIRAVVTLMDITEKDDNRLLIKQNINVEIEGVETPALVAEWLTMVVLG
jgi:acyl dehydratase